MKLAEAKLVPAREIRSGDLVLGGPFREAHTLHVVHAEPVPGLNGCKLICRDVGAPLGKRPYVFFVQNDREVPRVAVGDELYAQPET